MNERSRLFWPLKGASKPQSRRASRTEPPSLRRCDHPDCDLPGDFRAPKARDALTDYYWFCLDHVRAYNAAWNFYAGMNPDEIEALLRNDVTWERPTWPLGRRSSGFRFDAGKLRDGFGIFNEEFGDSVKERAPVSAAEMSALREMNLSQPLTVESLRSRYKELCKLHHPDANGGDKQSGERFKRIGQAYKTLMESLL